MSDHTAALEGSDPPLRQRSPPAGDPKYHYESLNDIATSPSTSVPYTKRRPSRTSSGAKVSPPSASPPRGDDHDESEQRNKPPRNTLKKLLRRDSHYTDTGPTSKGKQDKLDEEESTIGYMSRLGQIRESKSKVSTRSRRRASSTVSTLVDPKVLRRRHTGDNAVTRSHARGKHSSLQRHAGDMANVSDPSLVSSVAQQSDASGGINSTVLQRPYGGYSQFAEHQEPGGSHSLSASTAMENPAFNNMNTVQPEVFQYLQSSDTTENITPTDLQAMPLSTIVSSSSSSSGDTRLDDGRSSVAADSQHTIDSAMTSPASTRRSLQTSSHLPNQEFRTFKKPLYASSFVHGAGDEVDANEDEGSEEEDDGGPESEEEVNQKNQIPIKHPTETGPRRAPSTASGQSDAHGRRLKQQERELANHILQSPQPYKDFQYGAGQPAQNFPPMPMYSPQVYSGASPAAMHAGVNSPPGWAPMPSFPAPLAIGYAPHQSPEAVHAHPLSVRPPDGLVQHMPPRFTPHPGQPPLYQQHAPSSSQTRPTLVGYELLANELSGSSQSSSHGRKSVVPMYRKFEHLNHRVLLHLQDEMCELEEELRHLDECIAQVTPRDASGYAYPTSRRGDARYGSEMHFKRTELLGRIYQKLEQYNKALSAFSDVERRLDAATSKDIQAYREWMDEHEPVDEAESQFLEQESDLVTISRKASSVPVPAPVAGQDQSAAVWFPLTLVLPLMAFAIVPSLLGRFLVIVVIIGGELMLVTPTPQLLNLLSTREWTAAASIYFGVNVLLAALVRS